MQKTEVARPPETFGQHFPQNLDNRILQDANDRSKIAGGFFYNFVRAHNWESAMVGSGKKKADERMLGMISIELSMFMRWVEDSRGRMLKPEEADDIATRILDRENFQFGAQELLQITSLAFASDVGKIDEFRKKTQFDNTIDGFCQSIGIAKP